MITVNEFDNFENRHTIECIIKILLRMEDPFISNLKYIMPKNF